MVQLLSIAELQLEAGYTPANIQRQTSINSPTHTYCH